MSDLRQAIREVLVDGKLPCARAFTVAKKMGVEPIDVGNIATEESIKISHCQLGLFGYPEGERPVERIKDYATNELREAITSRLVNEQLPCVVAWQIACDLKIPKMYVSAAAENLHIRIRACQLGCFT
ncbi:MAG: hypothetical protein U9Q94_07650 [Candidatus Bipolaricaulota bacterium]|nr:hypothetical protein [Candidatus Bipolaricaulota bacterium]